MEIVWTLTLSRWRLLDQRAAKTISNSSNTKRSQFKLEEKLLIIASLR